MKKELIQKLKRRAVDYGINPDGRESQLIEAFEFKENKKLSEEDAIENACAFVSGIIGFYDINKRIERLEKEELYYIKISKEEAKKKIISYLKFLKIDGNEKVTIFEISSELKLPALQVEGVLDELEKKGLINGVD